MGEREREKKKEKERVRENRQREQREEKGRTKLPYPLYYKKLFPLATLNVDVTTKGKEKRQ